MAGFICPYCNMVMSLTNDTKSSQYPAFREQNGMHWVSGGPSYISSTLEITFYKCPNCGEFTILASGKGEAVKDVSLAIRPYSSAKQYPDVIPQSIREDYEEACNILQLSPKASATLSRRCLQGMIRDFWGITKNTLFEEVTALQDKIPADLWVAINGLRQLGNIGAHMEKNTDLIVDIDPGEADKLIQLIELLLKEWYINREERNKLFGDIFQINADKQAIRKGEG